MTENAPPPAIWPAVSAGVLAATVWWLIEFGSVDAFVEHIGINRNLFADFVKHYHWQARIVAGNDPVQVVPGFYYSPFLAILLWPLHGFDAAAARWPWAAIQLLALGAWVWLPLRTLGVRQPLVVAGYVGLALTCFPALHNFSWGQISVPLLALSLWSVARIHRGRSLTVGGYAPIGIALGIKYYPAGFALSFAAATTTKEWIRGMVRMSLVGAACLIVLPTLVMGWPTTASFYETAFANTQRAMATWIPTDPNSQYFGHVIMRWIGEAADGTRDALRWLGWLLAAAQVGWALWWARRVAALGQAETQRSQPALRLLAVAACAAPFVLTTSWPHYFVHLPLVALLLWRDSGQQTGAVTVAVADRWFLRGAALAIAISISPLGFEAMSDPRAYAPGGYLQAANLIAWLALWRTLRVPTA